MKDLVLIAAIVALIYFLMRKNEREKASDAPMINVMQYAKPTATSGGGMMGGGLDSMFTGII